MTKISTTVATVATAVVATVAVAAASCSLISGLRNGSYNPLNAGLNKQTRAAKDSMSSLLSLQSAKAKVNTLLKISELVDAENAAAGKEQDSDEAKKHEALKGSYDKIAALSVEAAKKAVDEVGKNKKDDLKAAKETAKIVTKVIETAKAFGMGTTDKTTVAEAVKFIEDKVTELSGKNFGDIV